MNNETGKRIRFDVMAIILIIIFSVAITPVTLQNDTFYTIKIGEYIQENGITMQEPFSWHENLEYTFPHWAYDVLIYLIYSIGGMTGIYVSTIIFAAILGITMYFVNVKLVKNRIISFIITLGAMYALKPFICARAQLITFILFILTIYFIEKFLETKKKRYALGLIVIPILIANLHLATFYFYFILYLPYIAEYMIYILAYSNVIISNSVVESIKAKIKKHGETEEVVEKLNKAEEKYTKLKEKQDRKMEDSYKIKIRYNDNIKALIIIFIICLFTGLLTPLGDTPYTYLIKTMQGISTQNISEHLPIVLADNTTVFVLLGIYFITIAFTKVKVRLSDLFMLAGLGVLTILSRRQASMLILIGSVILNRILTQILLIYNKEIIKVLEKHAFKAIGVAIISIIVIVTAIFQYKPKMDDVYVDTNSYPVQASKWIKENLNVEEIKLYNAYNYGSYLLYEGIPVFIDSRCDLYMPEFNENMYAFKDFLNLDGWNINNMGEKIEEYGFTHFIVVENSRIDKYLETKPEIYKKIYPADDIQDDNFTIFERVK